MFILIIELIGYIGLTCKTFLAYQSWESMQLLIDVIEWCDYIQHKDVNEHRRYKLSTVNLAISSYLFKHLISLKWIKPLAMDVCYNIL